jgi:hypothetical protein
MAAHLHAVSATLDLTDEQALLAEAEVEYHPAGVRNLLAALNLRSPAAAPADETVVIDMAVYRATANAHLATIFSAAG